MLKRSTAKSFKLITGKDLFALHKKMEKEQKKDDGELTELMDFLQYGLYLALYEPDVVAGKQAFEDFVKTDMFDTKGKSLTALTEAWSKEIN